MHKFSFRLEPVLKHREAREEKAALEQARAHEEYRRQYDNLCIARDKLNRAVQENCFASPVDIINQQIYCAYMIREIKKQEQVVDQSIKKFEQCRQKLVQAMQERSIMEKLKEKQFKAYNHAISIHEQKETDDLATRQCLHNR
ncbi:flagellar export protein FliJ [Desulfoscipio geothermicus]|jgi:flagellar FliJ protein|uniref:Flagellar FliJ protein n=1 Tax=Desulfoscipio geothermicus DSM 3669 TaxID=1121426 RepID=A0A1I6CV84_9FIRM|nr:flagellar export protein FliJ [Desulfoscipio geothermicus]SFQ97037.1 flagellar FliJ protein [Desulfoscipio geothermicus DSM 3669]